MRIELVASGWAWSVVPVLAEKWSFPDPKTFVVEVRRGVKFQNGEELTAEHVKAAFDAFVSPEKPGQRGVVLKALGSEEKEFRRRMVRRALAALETEIQGQTVFR